MENTSHPSMGIGPLGSSQTIFVRQFRWTFGSDHLPVAFTKSVKFDYTAKLIHMEYYEVYHPDYSGEPLQDWLNGPVARDTLVFTTYDGCSDPLYEQTFSGLKVLSDTANFDYSVSEASIRKLTINFSKTARRRVHSFPVEPTPEVINDPRDVTIDYLNARMIVPM